MNALQIIEQDIYSLAPQFNSVLSDKSISFEREAEFAIQILANSEYALKLATGNRQSVINAVTNVAAIGISLNPARKQAYLVPRDGRICLDISYMGLIDLAVASGSILWAKADVVRQSDGFTLNGYDKPPTHSFSPFDNSRGEIVGVYVVAKTADGDYLTDCMSLDEVNDIRDRSAAWKAWIEKKKKCPWVTDYAEMAKKTVIKRASKTWPKVERLQEAIHHLNTDLEEGLYEVQQEKPKASLEHLIAEVNNAPSLGELESVWVSGCKQIREAGDKRFYDRFKSTVGARGEQLKKAAVQEAV